jgi:hypothetical protein
MHESLSRHEYRLPHFCLAMLLWCLLLVASRAAAPSEDICEVYFSDVSAPWCNDEGMCEFGGESITCDEAYTRVAIRFAPPLLPALTGGLLYEPTIIHDTVWPPIRDASDPDEDFSFVHDIVSDLEGFVDQIDSEINFWSPRVVFVPDRIDSTLHEAYDLIQDLKRKISDGEVPVEYVSEILDRSSTVEGFVFRIVHATTAVLRMPNLRTNGALHALIPFLHFFCELNSAFILESIAPAGFLVNEPNLVATITQFHPGYGGDFVSSAWTIRLVNRDRVPWADYDIERFLVPMRPLVDERIVNPIFQDESGIRLLDYLNMLRYPRHGDAWEDSGYILASVMYFFEIEGKPEWIWRIVTEFCNTNLNLFDSITFPAFVRSRAQSVLYSFFKPCVDLGVRAEWAFQTVRFEDDNKRLPFSSSDETPMSMLRYVFDAEVGNLHSHMTAVEGTGWYNAFIRLVLVPALEVQADGSSRIRPKESFWLIERSVGRVLAFLVFEGDPDNLVFPRLHANCGVFFSWIDSMFFGSKTVRDGFYDWFRPNAFEDAFDLAELPELLNVISRAGATGLIRSN